jgi:DNA-binding NtrC family response regulator
VKEKNSILLIEDNAGQRKTLMDILNAKGYETFAAADGAEGLSFLQSHPVHLVLTDLGLPDMSGIDILREVKAGYPDIQLIILTGSATFDSAVDATNLGAFSYLLKPYDIELLLLNIQRANEKRQAEEDRERLIQELKNALAQVKQLQGILSICMYCKKIKVDEDSWQQLERYITEHSEADFSHCICPECAIKVREETMQKIEELKPKM